MDWDKHISSLLVWGGSIVTGVFTLLGVWFANRSSLKQLNVKLQHESERKRHESVRARLEELYSLVGRWADEVVTHHMTYRKVMEGKITYNQALEITLNRNSSVDVNRMFTLAELYFPSAHGALQELKAFRDEASSIQSSFKQLYRQGVQPSRKHADALTTVLEKFNAAIDKYQNELAAYAKDV